MFSYFACITNANLLPYDCISISKGLINHIVILGMKICCNHIKEQSIIITKSKLCGIKSHTKISIEYETINKQMMKHTQHRHYSPSLVNTT